MSDAWDPQQYHRFAAERRQPFVDLLSLVRPGPGLRTAVDLGCGSGEQTRELHDTLRLAETVGIDTSEAMLTEAAAHAGGGVRFAFGDLAAFSPTRPVDLVFANAALHWVPGHAVLLERLTAALGPGGQLAVQVPANADHPAHRLAGVVAGESPFREALGTPPPPDPVEQVLAPEEYAQVLDDLGYVEQHVRLQVYGHHLARSSDVVEWVKGTSLTRFRRLLTDEMFAMFIERYRAQMLAEVGDRAPYFYAFKRVLFWARRPG